MKKIICQLLFVATSLTSLHAIGQCAPGIPSAGNPACIPPNQQNSPYYQGDQQQAPALPSEPAPVWADRWGAVAVSFKDGRAGAKAQMVSKKEASEAALDICRMNGGTDCSVVLSYKNQCVAVAQPDGGGVVETMSAESKERASALALAKCGDNARCKVVYTECSVPQRVN
jgi:hypothetical protein